MSGDNDDDFDYTLETEMVSQKLAEAAKKETVNKKKVKKITKLTVEKQTATTKRKTRKESAREVGTDVEKEIHDLIPATFFARFFSFIIDSLFLALVGTIAFFFHELIESIAWPIIEYFQPFFVSIGFGGQPTSDQYLIGTVIVFYIIFFALPAAFFGVSFGKKFSGIRICDAKTTHITIVNILLRELILKWVCLPLVFIALFTENRRTLHDIIAGTMVVTKDSLEY